MRSRAPNYQVTVYDLKGWDQIARRGLDVIIDPFVYRLGQFFLEARDGGADRWPAITSDLGALVNFFDLVVPHDHLPAFNCYDTYPVDEDSSRYATAGFDKKISGTSAFASLTQPPLLLFNTSRRPPRRNPTSCAVR